MTEGDDGVPLLNAIGFRHARVFAQPRDRHAHLKSRLADIRHADDRRSAARHRRAGQWDMAFTRQQTGGRVEPNPTGTRNISLGPGVQVSKIGLRAGGAIEGLDVGYELDQITRNEARGNPEMAQHIDHEPGAVTARAALQLQRQLAALDPGLHPQKVGDVVLDALVYCHQKIVDVSSIADGASPKFL